ncbi:MAG: hypothetical protein LBR95_03760 [Azoarcus sp.]|nr:hypothetical protein [Azoarcus sp.]
MRPRQLISFLLSLFVMFATFPANMALASSAEASSGPAACHGAKAANTDSFAALHDADLHEQHERDAPASAQVQHACCTVVGILPLMAFSPLIPGAQEIIPFRPSLRLAASITGVYRPPRQNA